MSDMGFSTSKGIPKVECIMEFKGTCAKAGVPGHVSLNFLYVRSQRVFSIIRIVYDWQYYVKHYMAGIMQIIMHCHHK